MHVFFKYKCLKAAWIVLTLLTVLSTVKPVEAQSVTIGPAGTLGGEERRAVIVQGNYAYLAQGLGIDIVDISNPAAPLRVSGLAFQGEPQGFFISGSYLYATLYYKGLAIINISDPLNPVVVGSADRALSYGARVFVSGNHAYVASVTGGSGVSGLNIFDVSNPAAPVYKTQVNALCRDVFVEGNRAYAACGANMAVYNMTDPLNPVLDAYYGTSADAVYSITVANGRAYIGQGYNSGKKGLRVYNVSNENPTLYSDLGLLATPSTVSRVALSGDNRYAYLGYQNTNAFAIADVSNFGTSQSIVSTYTITPGTGEYASLMDITVGGGSAYLAVTGADEGLQIINVANPAAPAKTGGYRAPANTPQTFISGDRLYLMTHSGLWVYRTTTSSTPTYLGKYTGEGIGGARRIFAVGNRVYALLQTTPRKVLVLDTTNPAAITLAGTYTTSRNFSGVSTLHASGDYLYLLTMTGTPGSVQGFVEIINVAAAPAKAGEYNFTGEGRAVWVAGGRAYIAYAVTDASGNLTEKGIKILDVGQAASPALLGSTTDVYGKARALRLVGNTLFVGSNVMLNPQNPIAGTGKIEAFDVTDPVQIVKKGQTGVTGLVNDLDVLNGQVFAGIYGGSVYVYPYSTETGFGQTPSICPSPATVSIAVTTPDANGRGYVYSSEGTLYEYYENNQFIYSTCGGRGVYIQEYRLPGSKCCVNTIVSPVEAANDNCTAQADPAGDVNCGSAVNVSATPVAPWVFKEWSGAASGTNPETTATASAHCSQAVATFWVPTLTLGNAIQNPAAGTEVYAIESQYDFTKGRKNVPIAHVSLSVNEVDDWWVTSVGFETSGTGKENEDVVEARLYLNDINGRLLDTKQIGADNQTVSFAVNEKITKGQSITLLLVYDFKPDKAFPCNTYGTQTDISYVGAYPMNLPPGVKNPPKEIKFRGGPTGIKQGTLVIEPSEGNNQYGDVVDPKKPGDPAPLANPLKVRLGWQHPASVKHIDYRFNPPTDTFKGFMASTHGIASERPVDANGYAQETVTLGEKRGSKYPYYIQATADLVTTTCPYSEVSTLFTARGLGVDLATASQYDNPANGEKFGTFISNIQADNKFTLTIDMAPPDYATVDEVSFAMGSETRTGTVVTPQKVYEAVFDMAAFQQSQKLIVTVKMTKDGSQIEQQAEYDVKCLKLPTWVNIVAGICHPESFIKEFSGDDKAYKFTFNYPTNFAWSDSVPGNVGLLGGLSNNLDIEFTANAAYRIDETSTFGATIKGKPTILGKEFGLEGGLSGDFDPNFSFQRGTGNVRASFSFDLPAKGYSKTFLVYMIPVTAAVDLSGNVEIFVRGGAVLNRQMEFEEVTVAPGTTVTGNITISLAAVLGLAKIAATGSPTVTVEIELKYTSASGTATTWHGEVSVPITVVGSLFWGAAKATLYETTLGPWTFPNTGAMPAAFRPLGPLSSPPAPRLVSTSALAVDGEGRRMSVWVDDTRPEDPTPNPDVFFRYFNGTTWSAQAPIIGANSPNAEWETDPAVVFMNNGAALSCWTANKGEKTLSNLNAILAAQDITCAVWNGTVWGEPVKVISDAEADGVVSLAYDAGNNKAIAVWVHNADAQKNALNRTAWQLMYAVYDAQTGNWTPAQIIPDTNTGKSDQMPAVATDGAGNVILVWARDDDGQFYTELATVTDGTNVDAKNLDSRIMWSKLGESGWSMPVALATGGEATRWSPSLAPAPGGSFLAVWAEKEPGKKRSIKYAVFSGGGWGQPGNVVESEQFMEDPKAVVDTTGKATVIWRGYAAGGKTALFASTGQMPSPVWSEPQQITHDDTVQWQPTVVVGAGNKVVTAWSGYDMATGQAQSGAGFTGGVNVADATPGSATLTNVYEAAAIDANNDQLYETLQVSVGVNVIVPGNYEVRADLYAGDKFIAQARLTRNGLTAGNQGFVLVFPGGWISNRALDGPYTLKNVVVMDLNASAVQAAFAAAPFTTPQAYKAPQFVPGPLRLDKQVYTGTLDQALITLTDPLLNMDANSVQTVAVQVASARDGKGFGLTLTETGVNTGVFQGSLGFSLLASNPSLRQILVADHDVVQVVYDDARQNYRWLETASWRIGGAGDINGDGRIDLADAVIALQIWSGLLPAGGTIVKEADIDGNNRIGAEEAVYILQKLAGLR
jgi:hypothetical protein